MSTPAAKHCRIGTAVEKRSSLGRPETGLYIKSLLSRRITHGEDLRGSISHHIEYICRENGKTENVVTPNFLKFLFHY